MPKARHRALLGTVREETAALHRAIAAGREQEVKRHLEAGADPDFLQGMQGTALCNAIASNQPTIAQWLVQNGCDVNAVDFDQTPPLIQAIRRKYVDLVKVMLAHPNIQPNRHDPVTSQSPLHVAVELGYADVAQALLDCPKYDVSLRDNRTFTVLHTAVQLNLPDMVAMLAETDDLKLMFNHDGMLPIHLAAKLGSVEMFKLLCPPSVEDSQTMDGMDTKSKKAKEGKRLPAFVASSYTLDTPNMYSGWTALHFATCESHPEMVDFLLERKASVDLKTNGGATPLLLASSMGDCDSAEKLLKAGANPDVCGEVSVTVRSRYGVYHMTPLLIAAGSNNLRLARCLLSHGANIDGMDGAKELPLLTALKCRSTAVACLLLGLPVVEELERQPRMDEEGCDSSPSSVSTSASINQAAHVIRSCSDNSGYSWLQEGRNVWSDCNMEEHFASFTSLNIEDSSCEDDRASATFTLEGFPSPERFPCRVSSPGGEAQGGNRRPALQSSSAGASQSQHPAWQPKSHSPTLDNVKVSPMYQSASTASPSEAVSPPDKPRRSEDVPTLTSLVLAKKAAAQGLDKAPCSEERGEPFPEISVSVKADDSADVPHEPGADFRLQVARVDVHYKGETPLHAVGGLINGGGDLCRRLLELGCPVDVRNRRGNTALHEAVAYSNLEVVQALLEGGSNLHLTDLDGDSVLHLAAREGDVAMGKLLLQAGADPDREGEGLDPEETPLRAALDSDNVDFVRLLISAGCDVASEDYLVHLEPAALEADLDGALLEVDAPAIFYEDVQLLSELMHLAHQPVSLLTLCLNQVRQCFRQKGLGGFQKMKELPLPSAVIDKLMFVNL